MTEERNSRTMPILKQMVLDLVILGVAGGVVVAIIAGIDSGVSFTAMAWWLGLNLALLAWLLGGMSAPRPMGKLYLFGLACVKIALAYYILYVLLSAAYLDAMGMAYGAMALPVVLVFRGLSGLRRQVDPGKDELSEC